MVTRIFSFSPPFSGDPTKPNLRPRPFSRRGNSRKGNRFFWFTGGFFFWGRKRERAAVISRMTAFHNFQLFSPFFRGGFPSGVKVRDRTRKKSRLKCARFFGRGAHGRKIIGFPFLDAIMKSFETAGKQFVLQFQQFRER